MHASTQPEPYGKVVLEAMASRRAVVAAAAGGVVELVDDGRTGVLVPPGDAAALAEAIGRLLRSPEERRRIADAGQRHVEEKFSLERDGGELQRVWREALNSARLPVQSRHEAVAWPRRNLRKLASARVRAR